MKLGIIIVDHGSRRIESNDMLEQLAAMFAQRYREKYEIVEPAHMELSEPSIGTAYDRCVGRGAEKVICCPFFLGPGKHWTQDIPRLVATAAQRHPGTSYHVTPYIGIDELIVDLLEKRVSTCGKKNYTCEQCAGTLRSGEGGIEIPDVGH